MYISFPFLFFLFNYFSTYIIFLSLSFCPFLLPGHVYMYLMSCSVLSWSVCVCTLTYTTCFGFHIYVCAAGSLCGSCSRRWHMFMARASSIVTSSLRTSFLMTTITSNWQTLDSPKCCLLARLWQVCEQSVMICWIGCVLCSNQCDYPCLSSTHMTHFCAESLE